jgi:flagellar hook-length control protein FliK
MTAPVATAPPVVRAPSSSAADGDANSAAPFASALDGALSAGRAPVGPRSPDSRGSGPRDGMAPGHRTHQPDGVRHSGRHRGEDRPEKDEPTTTDTDPTAPVAGDPAAPAPVATTSALPPLWTLALAAAPAPTVTPAPTATLTDTPPTLDAVVGSVVLTPPTLPAGLPPLPGFDPSVTRVATATDPVAATPPMSTALPADAAASPVGPAVDPTPTPTPSPTAAAPTSMLPAGAVVTSVTAAPAAPATEPAAAAAPTPDAAATAVAPVDPSVVQDVAAPAAPAQPLAPAPTETTAGDDPAPVATQLTAPAVPVAGAVAASAGSAGSGGSSSANTGDQSSSDPAPAAPDATLAAQQAGSAPQPAPVAPIAATPAAQPALPVPVATQLVQHVAVLGRGPDGTQAMTVVLHPDNLGPVQVEVTVTRGTIDLTMRGAHEQGRAALMQALPDLRRDLESAGLTCSRLDVDRDTGGSWTAQHQNQQSQAQAGQQSSADGRGQQHHRTEPRAYAWGRPVDLGAGRGAGPSTRSTSSGVDVRV